MRKEEVNKNNFSITYTIKGRLPRLPFLDMKNAVLGKKYRLSLVIADRKLMKKLNRIYRNKNAITDVLSFPLDTEEGEIFLNQDEAALKAGAWNRSRINFIGFLFIHSLLHLKGLTHSSRMESEETKFLKKFGI